ncbi:FAD-dependent 5-carboxymethylaminomethyl-2-thiouridine(34) oxidoreductase MnmC [Sessilibacter corallicola]|uniref:FAD-dependent 5-carboxymethylaminomethyl-2-thiouridine(34) oxidoreductase MnmC n=1 Tax=Sessilibacter corallicola TaxID=2904075 RepID=UPI001E434DF4|nr:FAD-dependent 5-carboxymethylaminomethyl-2-thiouridine(34) oxidoreductase MnmC [Sessilibacter corallicola]
MTDSPPTFSYAQLNWDEQGQPISSVFGDVYFSKTDGLGETEYVFLHHNQLAQRWQALSENESFVIGETGFGTGLNFLCAWNTWLQTAPASGQLHFVSVERYPLSLESLEKSLELWPQLKPLSDQLIHQYPKCLVEGVHRLEFANVSLTLIIGDAVPGFKELQASFHPDYSGGFAGSSMDAWFLDGFAPSKNPQMWSQDLFEIIARLSKPQTTFATFTSAGLVRRGLAAVGFSVVKEKGYGNKREMIRGVFDPALIEASEPELVKPEPLEQTAEPRKPIVVRCQETPWQVMGETPEKYQSHRWQEKTVAVIGGGLAGCISAYALSQRGFDVQIFESQDDIAQAASGNPQGVVYARMSPETGSLPNFNLQALQAAERFYAPFWSDYPSIGKRCGVLQLAFNDKQQALQDQISARFGHQDLFSTLDSTAASELAGVSLNHGGLYFPDCGWVHPRNLCRTLLAQKDIPVQASCTVTKIKFEHGLWTLFDDRKTPLGQFSHVVVANAKDALALKQSQHLPLRSVRGQVSFVPSTAMSSQLNMVVCSEGYLAPADASGHHCLGATFNPKSEDLTVFEHDHLANFAHIDQFSHELGQDLAPKAISDIRGRAAIRCTTPDYLPIVGPLPIPKRFDERFDRLRKNARQHIPCAGSYYPGLYTSVGYGSRALAYLPLATQLLVAHMNHEPNPIGFELARALHPARFLIRDIARNKR